MMRNVVPILWFVAAEALAQGGPPLITDDTGTPGDHKWENNIAAVVESSPGGKIVRAPSVDLNYGLGEHVQLNYQIGLIQQAVHDQPKDPGLTQHVVGAKWRFVDAESDAEGVSISTYPKLGLHGPSSSPNVELTPKDPQLEVPFEVKMGFGSVAVTTEVGRAFSGPLPDAWFYGAAAGYSGTPHMTLNLEAHGECDAERKQSEWLLNAGSHIEISDAVDMIVAIGRFVKALDPPQEQIYAGVTLRQ